jgi:hypothetical protein
MRSDHKSRELGWTRPTVRLDPETSRKLSFLLDLTGSGVGDLVSSWIDEAFRKATRTEKKER